MRNRWYCGDSHAGDNGGTVGDENVREDDPLYTYLHTSPDFTRKPCVNATMYIGRHPASVNGNGRRVWRGL